MPAATETVVLGIGNVVHSDDGAGVYAARMLHEDARLPEGTEVIEGGTLGLELLPYPSGRLSHSAAGRDRHTRKARHNPSSEWK